LGAEVDVDAVVLRADFAVCGHGRRGSGSEAGPTEAAVVALRWGMRVCASAVIGSGGNAPWR
jgi:hypothetical protein